MVNDIAEATKKAGKLLHQIKELPINKIEESELLPLIRGAVNTKLMIDENEENQIRELVILSIKMQDYRMGNLSGEFLYTQVKKYDCHQTSLVTQKKVLLFMYIERELGIHMDDETATSIETIEELTRIVMKYLKKERNEYGCGNADSKRISVF